MKSLVRLCPYDTPRSYHQRRCSGPAANFLYAADALPLKTSVTVSALKVLQRR